MKRNLFIKLIGAAAIIVFVISALAGCSLTGVDDPDIQEGPGGTLKLWDAGPLTLDPAISSEMSSHLYIMQIFNGLVKLNENLEPVSDLAERWTVSPDGKTYTFLLRRDALFHDGKPITASDVKYSWERACSPATGSQTASTYLNDIVGSAEVLSGQAQNLSGVSVIDDHTLSVTIDAPKVYFLSKLAYPTAFVVDRQNVETGGNWWWYKPNGSGPYRMAKWNVGSLIILQPNQHYYGKKATARLYFQLLDGVPMSLYETGKIDVVEISQLYLDRATDKTGPFFDQLHIYPEFSLQYIGFNTAKPPFDDPLVREAFSHSVDKDHIIRIIEKNMVSRADGILPPGMPGYNKDLKGLNYDPVYARELLAKSKYSSGLPPITITVLGWGGVDVDPSLGAAIQDWKKNLGAEVSVRLLEPDPFHYNLQQEADEMYELGWVADYPDPQNFLQTLFYTGTEYNNGRFSSSEFDSLIDRAAVEQDRDKRMELYRQAEQIVVDQAPVIPLWFNRNYVLVNPQVKNYSIDPLGVPRLNLVSIEH
ncbi:MAG: peptide ABC transporter substrate-binding protein [Dehalococcoidia bacterium]